MSYSYEPYTIRYSKDRSKEDPSAPLYDPNLPGGGLDPELLKSPYLQYLYPDKTVDSETPFERARKQDQKDPWAASMINRAAIRTFSRGVLGAAFYAWGQNRVGKEMREYHYDIALKDLPKLRTLITKAGKDHYELDRYSFTPLRYLARGIDKVYGNSVYYGINRFAKLTGKKTEQADEIAQGWTTFRDKADFARKQILDSALAENEIADSVYTRLMHTKGRSVGNELVSMTFDFAMGSVGDALGREIASWFDPNHPKTFLKDGKMDYGEFSKHLLNTSWRILSYNQLEDWFAGIPYIYQMHFQRQILNHGWRGFKQTADRQLNGGGHLGNIQKNINGEYTFKPTMSYSLPGLLDLQFRFTGYNWYTLMFRDAHERIKNAWEKFSDNGYAMSSLPSIHIEKPSDTIEGLGQTVRYGLKSLIKSTIYMTPAVPFFWIFRTPQTKDTQMYMYYDDKHEDPRHRGIRTLQINDQHSHVRHGNRIGRSSSFKEDKGYGYFIEKYEYGDLPLNTEIIDARKGLDSSKENGKIYRTHNERYIYKIEGKEYQVLLEPDGKLSGKYNIPKWAKATLEHKDPFDPKAAVGLTERILNPLGKLCYDAGTHLHNFNKMVLGGKAFSEQQVRTYAKAAISYTPYMYAKGETAIRFDNKVMDEGIYKVIDGVFGLNKDKIQSGSRTIKNLITHPPYELVDMASRTQTGLAETRKKIAKKEADTSDEIAVETITNTNAQPDTTIAANAAMYQGQSKERFIVNPYKNSPAHNQLPDTKITTKDAALKEEALMKSLNFDDPARPSNATLH